MVLRPRDPKICLLLLVCYSRDTEPPHLPAGPRTPTNRVHNHHRPARFSPSRKEDHTDADAHPRIRECHDLVGPRVPRCIWTGNRREPPPRTLTNVPAGKHNLVVTMLGYKESNSTITVTADKILWKGGYSSRETESENLQDFDGAGSVTSWHKLHRPHPPEKQHPIRKSTLFFTFRFTMNIQCCFARLNQKTYRYCNETSSNFIIR